MVEADNMLILRSTIEIFQYIETQPLPQELKTITVLRSVKERQVSRWASPVDDVISSSSWRVTPCQSRDDHGKLSFPVGTERHRGLCISSASVGLTDGVFGGPYDGHEQL